MIQKFPYKQVSMQKTASYFILKHLNNEHPFYKEAPRFELGTFRSAVECSTTELYPHKCLYEFTFDILDYNVLILREKPLAFNFCFTQDAQTKNHLLSIKRKGPKGGGVCVCICLFGFMCRCAHAVIGRPFST